MSAFELFPFDQVEQKLKEIYSYCYLENNHFQYPEQEQIHDLEEALRQACKDGQALIEVVKKVQESIDFCRRYGKRIPYPEDHAELLGDTLGEIEQIISIV